MGDFQFIIPECILLMAALFTCVESPRIPSMRGAGSTALAAVIAAMVVLPWSSHGSLRPFSSLLINDATGVFFKTVILLASGFVILLSLDYNQLGKDSREEYYFFILVLTSALMLAVSSHNLMMIYLTLEAVSLISYILAGYARLNIFSSEAGLKYFFYGTFSTGMMLYGMSLLYGLTGTLDLTLIGGRLGASPGAALALILLLAGFGFKCSLAPFHMWTPDVYQGAPLPAAAFFSVAPKAMGFALLLRVFTRSLDVCAFPWPALATVISALTMVIGNVMALRQDNVKRLLAYSTIAQAGYMLMGLAVAGETGLKASLFYIFVYIFMNVGAFGAVIAVSGGGRGESIKDYSGLYKRDPFTAVAFAAALLSLGGLPPLAGFMAKFLILAAVVDARWIGLALLIVVNSVIAMYYYLRIIKVMFCEDAPGSPPAAKIPGVRLVLFLTLLCNVLFGVWPHLILQWLLAI